MIQVHIMMWLLLGLSVLSAIGAMGEKDVQVKYALIILFAFSSSLLLTFAYMTGVY